MKVKHRFEKLLGERLAPAVGLADGGFEVVGQLAVVVGVHPEQLHEILAVTPSLEETGKGAVDRVDVADPRLEAADKLGHALLALRLLQFVQDVVRPDHDDGADALQVVIDRLDGEETTHGEVFRLVEHEDRQVAVVGDT